MPSDDNMPAMEQLGQVGQEAAEELQNIIENQTQGSDIDELHSEIDTDLSQDRRRGQRETIINPAEYCMVTEEMCRAPTSVKCTDGESRICVCAKLKEDCSRHVRQVGKHPSGWYRTVAPQQQLEYSLGEAEAFVSDDTMQEIKQLARDAAARVPEDDTDEEIVDVTPRASNSNRSTSHHRNRRGSPHGSISDRTRSGRQGTSLALPNYPSERTSQRKQHQAKPRRSSTKDGSTSSRSVESLKETSAAANIRRLLSNATTPRSKAKEAPRVTITGILLPDGTRYVTNKDKKIGAAIRKGGTVAGTFDSSKEAQTWVDAVDDSGTESDVSYSRRPSRHSRRSLSRSHTKSKHQRSHRQPVFSVSTQSDEMDSVRSRGYDPPVKKKIDMHRTDPSNGAKEKIFGTAIDGRQMDKKISPPDLDSDATLELYDMAPDIASLPGKHSIVSGEYGLGEQGDQINLVDAFQQTFLKGAVERVVQRDRYFNKSTRNAFSEIKNEDCLRDFINNLDECREAVFNRFDRGITQFMLLRRYSSEEIEIYQETGGLPQIIRKTFQLYKSLLETIYTEFRKAETYERGLASALVKHHSKELLKVRTYALTKKDVLLRTYTYLRDASTTDFHSHKVQKYLWERLEECQALATNALWTDPADSALPAAKAVQMVMPAQAATPVLRSAARRCSHCSSARLHALCLPAVGPSRTACPFRALPPVRARKVRAAVIAAFDKDPAVTHVSHVMIQLYLQKEADGDLDPS